MLVEVVTVSGNDAAEVLLEPMPSVSLTLIAGYVVLVVTLTVQLNIRAFEEVHPAGSPDHEKVYTPFPPEGMPAIVMGVPVATL